MPEAEPRNTMNDNRKIWNDIFQLSQAVFRVTHLFPKDEILKRHLREKITEILYQSSQRFNLEHPEVEPRNIAIEKQKLLINLIHDFRGLLFITKNCNFVDEKNLSILIKECVNLIESLDPKKQERGLTSGIREVEPGAFYQPQDLIFNTQNNGRNFADQASIENNISSKTRTQKVAKISKFEGRTSGQNNNFIENSLGKIDNSPEIGFSILNSRQQKILDYFQKTTEEKNRLKDISKELKSIHPRTLRQDLKYLCDNGHLDRNGSGPGSFYSFVKK